MRSTAPSQAYSRGDLPAQPLGSGPADRKLPPGRAGFESQASGWKFVRPATRYPEESARRRRVSSVDGWWAWLIGRITCCGPHNLRVGRRASGPVRGPAPMGSAAAGTAIAAAVAASVVVSHRPHLLSPQQGRGSQGRSGFRKSKNRRRQAVTASFIRRSRDSRCRSASWAEASSSIIRLIGRLSLSVEVRRPRYACILMIVNMDRYRYTPPQP